MFTPAVNSPVFIIAPYAHFCARFRILPDTYVENSRIGQVERIQVWITSRKVQNEIGVFLEIKR